MFSVRSHKQIERFEVSCESKTIMSSLKNNLKEKHNFELKKEWEGRVNGKTLFYALFERETKIC